MILAKPTTYWAQHQVVEMAATKTEVLEIVAKFPVRHVKR